MAQARDIDKPIERVWEECFYPHCDPSLCGNADKCLAVPDEKEESADKNSSRDKYCPRIRGKVPERGN